MQIKNRQQMLTIVALVVVALYAGDRLVFSPLVGVWKARSEQIDTLRHQVTEGKFLLQREQIIRSHWTHMQINTLTNNTSAAEQRLYQALNAWAQDSRSAITAISPQWKHDADEYMTYLCRVEAAGNLSSLSKFIFDIEQDPMALKLESLELSARDKQGQVLALAVQLSGLVLTPKEKLP